MNNLQAALHYRGLGFSVLPISEHKNPLVLWQKYQKERATEEQIRVWYEKEFPNAGVGIITGEISGIIVVDVEAGGKSDDLPLTATARSGGGGLHFYYRHPGVPVRNGTRIGDKADLRDIRGDGGLVVAPPSKHHSGGHYEWITPIESVDKFAEFPMWVLENKKQNSFENKWQEKTAGVFEGSRNDTATQIAGKLLKHIPHKDWESFAWSLLQGWNMRNKPEPLSDGELRKVFDSIAGREFQKETQSANPVNKKLELKVWSVGEILALDIPEPEWLIETFISKPSLAALVGPPENFKSWLYLHLAISVARKSLALGRFQCKQGHVLIIDEENNIGRIKFRLQALGSVESDPIDFMVLAGFKADNQDWMRRVMEICRAKGTKLVIADSLVRIHSQNENESGGMAKVFDCFKEFIREGISVLYTHHPSKQVDFRARDPLQSMRGSGDIPAQLDTAFEVKHLPDEDILVIKQTKARDAEKLKPFEVRIVRNDHRVPIDFQFIGTHDDAKKKAGDVAEALPAVIGNKIMSFKEIEAVLIKDYGTQAIRDGVKIAENNEDEHHTIERVPKGDLPDGYDTKGGKRYYRVRKPDIANDI